MVAAYNIVHDETSRDLPNEVGSDDCFIRYDPKYRNDWNHKKLKQIKG